MSLRSLALALSIVSAASMASAQTLTTEELRVLPAGSVKLRTAWSPTARQNPGAVELWVPGGTGPLGLHAGVRVRTSLAVRPDSALVAMLHGGTSPWVHLALVELQTAAHTKHEVDARITVHRGYGLTEIIACPDPDGFTVMWQEVSSNGGRTFMARVLPGGGWITRPREIPVPWGLGAVAWNGAGYLLGVYYNGNGPGLSIIAYVSLTPTGTPEQHPGWATPAEAFGALQLLETAPGVVTGIYRAGEDGTAIRQITVAGVGVWGVAPTASIALGTAAPEVGFTVVAAGADGGLQLRTE